MIFWTRTFKRGRREQTNVQEKCRSRKQRFLSWIAVFALPRRRTHPTSGRSPDSRFIGLAAFPTVTPSLHLKRRPRGQWHFGQPSTITVAGPCRILTGFPFELLQKHQKRIAHPEYAGRGKKSRSSSSAVGSRSLAKPPWRKMACMISPDLLEILVCPACKKPLVQKEDGSSLKCGECRRVYPVRDDIPILLVDEASVDTA